MYAKIPSQTTWHLLADSNSRALPRISLALLHSFSVRTSDFGAEAEHFYFILFIYLFIFFDNLSLKSS